MVRDCHVDQEPRDGRYACGSPVTPTSSTAKNREQVTCLRCARSDIDARFWKKVNKDGPNKIGTPCWLWTGALQANGYGSFWINRTTIGAHRYSYNLHNKVTLPSHLCACHKCDTPLCVNPEHLFAGTVKENALDMSAKNRAPKTPKHSTRAAHKAMALQMLALGIEQSRIVLETGFTKRTLRAWRRVGKHLTPRTTLQPSVRGGDGPG